jgi:hypothetical protein
MLFTAEMDKYIREIAEGRLTSEIADMMNAKFGTDLTVKQIKSYKNNHKIRSGRSKINYKGRTYYNRLLTEEQIEYLNSIYIGISNRECTDKMNKKFDTNFTCRQIKSQKQRLKLNSGLDGRFKKGQSITNSHQFKKGERSSIETEFKKGQVPKNWVPVGTEVIRGDGYKYIKISDIRGAKYPCITNWKQKHLLNWEKVNGPVPKGHCLIFLDGNKLNTDIDNLAIITYSQRLIMCRNHLIYDDPELTKAAINVAKVIDATNKKKKKVKKS